MPSRAHSAQHHHSPIPTPRRTSQDGYVDTYDDALHGVAEKKSETGFWGGHREPVRGRKWDHKRDGDPIILQSDAVPRMSPWRTYVKSTMYGPALEEDRRPVDEEFLQQQTPGYEKPWRGDLEGNAESDTLVGIFHNKKRQKSLLKRLQVRTQRIFSIWRRLTELRITSSCTLWSLWYSES
jgi:hypothetical protein